MFLCLKDKIKKNLKIFGDFVLFSLGLLIFATSILSTYC